MDDKLVTLAIHTYQKAQILKMLLERDGIDVYLHNVNLIQPVVSSGVRVRIKESDLPAALKIIESSSFQEDEQQKEKKKEYSNVVLVPVDFSDFSKHACNIGFNYAQSIGAEVVIMHAYFAPFFPVSISFGESFAYQTSDEATMVALLQKAQEEMDKLSNYVKQQIQEKNWPDIQFNCLLRDGLPEEEIIAWCKQFRPAMVVMGTRGKNQKDADLIGSVTAEVIEMIRVPLLAIPENTPFYSFSEIKQIAFGTNFEQKDLIAIDQLFKMFAKNPDVRYFLFHVSGKQDKWDEIKLGGIREYFEKQYPGKKIHYDIIDANDFILNLEKYIRKHQIDIISLTTHRRNLFARIFSPSIARKMLFHTDTPMLVLNP